MRIHPENPRYFSDAGGRPLYLTGSHHWDVLLDIWRPPLPRHGGEGRGEGGWDQPERPGGFDFEGYLDRLTAWGHNFFRLWTHEAWTHEIHPTVYLKTGPRFDLSRFNPEYFERLRARVARARERGFYVAVMLFNGWSIHDNGEGDPWPRHPFHRLNNGNGIDGGNGVDVHTLRFPAITRLQEAYVRKVVETVGDLDVLWEISNESPGESRDWQYHLIRYLKTLSPHPVGMTSCFPRGRNEDLFASPADWISPNRRGGYMRSPPPADGSKVVILDTDHLWGIGGDRAWVWKSFLAGHHPIYMDPLDADPRHEDVRRALGATRRLAERLDLARMVPSETVVYLPKGRGKIPFTGEAEWIDPGTGAAIPAGRVSGRVRAPFRGDAVLYLTAPATVRAISS